MAQNLLCKLKWAIKVQQYNLNKEVILKLIPVFETSGKKMLDIGCNDGIYTKTMAEKANICLQDRYGVDYNPEVVPPFSFIMVDLEDGKLPYESNFFDIVVADQVLEHLKNIGRLLDEVNRVMKNGGQLIISVPNLASLPNRFLLLAGRMPLAIQGMEHHIRGFTPHAIRTFLEGKNFKVTAVRGGAFYPGPKALSRILQSLFPSLSHFICIKAEKIKDITDVERSKDKHFHQTKLE